MTQEGNWLLLVGCTGGPGHSMTCRLAVGHVAYSCNAGLHITD